MPPVMLDAPSITALLGPTNTGKTHRALKRMLEHDSGVIGVPLRLLAREVYDKLTTRVGERKVALVTGEEKRVPARPSYWVCTVEAMPVDLVVDFVAIDEVQLAAHEQRGHVFTDRVLHARGRKETWLLGAETVAPILQRLIPGLQLMRLPRLSRLSHVPATGLPQVPPRSAVIAFSADKVFEAAERLRARRGGAAVVLGVLSPRTRNAQVAMYEAGEVDWIVATDAIGMGLNLDVRHVAFAATRKFDGREARELDPAEFAQIAGRAGRHMRDGTFGAVAPLSLPNDVVRAVETHRFAPVTRLRWRSAELDFASPQALIDSLRVGAPNELLQLDRDAEDLQALVALASVAEVSARARDQAAVRMLWDVCRVPDYRKLLFESHVALLAELFTQLEQGQVSETLIGSRLRELDDTRGDIDTLTARLAGVRTWSYVAHQRSWLERAGHFQELTRDLEDRLSDALHAKLIERFVERSVGRSLPARAIEATRAASVDPGHPFARLASLRAELGGAGPTPQEDLIEALVDAVHADFELRPNGAIEFRGSDVARLVRGPSLLAPDIRLVGLDELAPGARARVTRRLVAYARDVIDELLGPLRSVASALSSAGRGLAYQLERGLGTVLSCEAHAQIEALTAEDLTALQAIGLQLGKATTRLAPLQRPAALWRRALLLQLYGPAPSTPKPGVVSFKTDKRFSAALYTALGYPAFGGRAIRADVAESVHAALTTDEPPTPDQLARWLGCSKREVPRIAAALTHHTTRQR